MTDAAAIRNAVCEEAARITPGRFAPALRALILTGSMARDEATVVATRDAHTRVLGDAEFVAVFRDHACLPGPSEADAMREQIGRALAARGIDCAVDLSAVRPSFLSNMQPHIFGYELRACGRVIWGDAAVLELIPTFTSADLPREDAWRLLANRMLEFLEIAGELDGSDPLPEQACYRTVKLYLDMATSLLVFACGYAPTYGERSVRLATLAAASGSAAHWPFSLVRFAQRVAECTSWKIGAAAGAPPPAVSWTEAVRCAQALWRWELRSLTNSGPHASDDELWEQWRRAYPRLRRLRGWAHAARNCGWLASWPHWPAWLWAARRGSPRYCLYEAGMKLLFSLPSGSAPGSSLSAAADIARNYRRYVADTRA